MRAHSPLGDDGLPLAVKAEAIYLTNLLLLPGLAFAVLCWLWWRSRNDAPPLARNHLQQTMAASLWAVVLLLGLSVAILGLGGFKSMYTWLAVILYFTFVHSAFVLCGMIGLSKALAGKSFVFPLIGIRTKP